MRKIFFWITIFLFNICCEQARAVELNYSARYDIWENPFLAYGYNPETKRLTGYFSALRTAPGRTDECKLAFAMEGGGSNFLSVRYMGEVDKKSIRSNSGISITTEGGEFNLKFLKKLLGGDCDWILPFVVGSAVREVSEEIIVPMKSSNTGSWVGVYVISAAKAKFHAQPDIKSTQKAFVVEGDVIYVYEERPGWYFVKFEEGERKTVGWIKKSDTVQP